MDAIRSPWRLGGKKSFYRYSVNPRVEIRGMRTDSEGLSSPEEYDGVWFPISSSSESESSAGGSDIEHEFVLVA